MKPLTILLAAILFFTSCSKNEIIAQSNKNKCDRATTLSYKFRADSTFIRVDTSWQDFHCCDLNSIRVEIAKGDWWTSWINCPPPYPALPEFKIECIRYVIGNKFPQPPKLK